MGQHGLRAPGLDVTKELVHFRVCRHGRAGFCLLGLRQGLEHNQMLTGGPFAEAGLEPAVLLDGEVVHGGSTACRAKGLPLLEVPVQGPLLLGGEVVCGG